MLIVVIALGKRTDTDSRTNEVGLINIVRLDNIKDQNHQIEAIRQNTLQLLLFLVCSCIVRVSALIMKIPQ